MLLVLVIPVSFDAGIKMVFSSFLASFIALQTLISSRLVPFNAIFFIIEYEIDQFQVIFANLNLRMREQKFRHVLFSRRYFDF